MTKSAIKSKKPYSVSKEVFKSAVQGALMEALFLPVGLNEPQDVKVKPGFETACWSFQPPHKIFVGDGLFDKWNIRKGLSPEQQNRYIRNHYHHEQAHGLFTERDMTVVKTALKRIRAPFSLFNIMEDAVIEHRYRQANDYRFNWLEYEHLGFNDRPESLLLAFIQAEGDREVVKSALEQWPETFKAFTDLAGERDIPDPENVRNALKPVFDRVWSYYERLLNVKGTMAVFPLISAWLKEFGMPPPPPSPSPSKGSGQQSPGNGGMQDMSHTMEMAQNPQALADFEKDAESLEDGTPVKNKFQELEADANHKAEAQSGDVLGKGGAGGLPVCRTRAESIARKFLPLFKTRISKVSTLVPSKRISSRNMMLGRPPYRRKKVEEGKGKKKVLLILDCSGSMSGHYIEEGKVLIAALSNLAKLRHVEGHVVLSIVNNEGPRWQRFALPMAQDQIDKIKAYGNGEGLEYSIQSNIQQARDADYVFVYTDAQISDKAVNKSALHSQGVFTWGLYAGDDEALPSLLKYFDKAILRKTTEELVDAILAQTK